MESRRLAGGPGVAASGGDALSSSAEGLVAPPSSPPPVAPPVVPELSPRWPLLPPIASKFYSGTFPLGVRPYFWEYALENSICAASALKWQSRVRSNILTI